MANKELIEKVSEAIADADGEERDLYPAYYDALANAATSTILAALQEPTEAMVDAWWDELGTGLSENWSALLNASPLGEQS